MATPEAASSSEAQIATATTDGKSAKGGKAAKVDKKAERAALRGKSAAAMTQADPADPLKDQYGDTELIASREASGRQWSQVEACSTSAEGDKVLLRGRVHAVRGKGKSAFLVLRQRTSTMQLVMFADDKVVSKGMVKYASLLPRESIIDVEGSIFVPKDPVQGCTQSETELHVISIRCISRADTLPFEVTDAARSTDQAKDSEAQFVTVSADTRLDNRCIDLRTPVNQAIFHLQSKVCQLFRELLAGEGFQEIHSPKLIAGASEGGSAVFKLDYMGQDACLAQSPQIYKQMALAADMRRVFEITPVFRAENSNTHRHLCEFTGLDFEMEINEHYDEVLDVLDRLFVYIFNGLQASCAKELGVINEQYPFKPLEFLPKTLRIPFEEGIQMLHDDGLNVDPLGDLNTEAERRLGALVKDKYHTDFYILTRYPLAVRPFYTMPDPVDSKWSNSYDVFIRGEEIISGAQRVHDAGLLAERAKVHGIPLDSIHGYIDSMKYGMPPHGGAGIGLERVVMLFCGLDNIRKTSMFPRDPKRLSP